MNPWQVFELGEKGRRNLLNLLRQQKKIFSFTEQPYLASLTACLGLQFEVGRPGFDRLSQALGIDPEKDTWNKEIISMKGEFGIRLWVEGKDLHPNDRGLLPFFHPLSAENNRLKQMFIFPNQVARHYEKRGIELVVVRDWALDSFLCDDPQKRINYVKTSKQEIENNAAFTQSELMFHHQQPFTGAHDIADHLAGASFQGRNKSYSTVVHAWNVMNEVFTGKEAKKSQLMLSYLIGVILDDLAQPLWYGSKHHEILADKCLKLLKDLEECEDRQEPVAVTDGFAQIVKFLRSKDEDFERKVDQYLGLFTLEILGVRPEINSHVDRKSAIL